MMISQTGIDILSLPLLPVCPDFLEQLVMSASKLVMFNQEFLMIQQPRRQLVSAWEEGRGRKEGRGGGGRGSLLLNVSQRHAQ